MKAERILRVLGNVDDAYIEEMLDTKSQRRNGKQVWLIAAIVALMALLVGCVAYVLSLNDLKLAESPIQEVDVPEVTEIRDIISLQGFVGSVNYQAAKEWYEFRQAYDPDGKILQSLSNKETMMPEEYWSYNCYTEEMTAKVDEICETYGLNKQGMANLSASETSFYKTLQIGRIVREDAAAEVTISPAYFYKTGSFLLSCETKLTGEDAPWIYPIDYQYRCVMKSDFDEVYLSVDDIESYDQWTYTTQDGTEALLALGPDKALVIVDLENAFVTMNILNPRVGDILYGEQMMTREALEAFADTFDFSFEPQPVSDEQWEAVQASGEEKQAELDKLVSAGTGSYAERVRYLLENASRPEMLDYALMDIDGDGTEELLIARRQHICCIYTVEGDRTVDLLEYPVSRYIYSCLWEEDGRYKNPSPMYLCEGNAVVCIYTDLDTDRVIYHFAVPVDGEMVWMEEIGWDMNNADTPYYEYTMEEGSDKGYNDICTPISEERYNEVLGSYVRVKLEWTPLSEYPLE